MAETVEAQLQQYIVIEVKSVSISSGGITCFWAPPEGLQPLLQHLPNPWVRRRDNPADAPIFVASLRHWRRACPAQ